MGDFSCVAERTARRQHACIECKERIVAGEKYTLFTGVCEGEFYSAKMCEDCCVALAVVHRHIEHDNEGPVFGDLAGWLQDTADSVGVTLPDLEDPQPDTKTVDMFAGLPPIKRKRTRRERIRDYSRLLEEVRHG